MRKLVLLGGPPGVGKSTVLLELQDRDPDLALLDADDVWRVSTGLDTVDNGRFAIRNVVSVMRGYFEAGCSVGLTSWVFARPELYQPVIDGLEDLIDSVQMLYLVADAGSIESRLQKRGETGKLKYALNRMALIESLPFTRLDTTFLTPSQVADCVYRELKRDIEPGDAS